MTDLPPMRFGSEIVPGNGGTGCESSGEDARVNTERCFEGDRLGVRARSPFSVRVRRRDGLLGGAIIG